MRKIGILLALVLLTLLLSNVQAQKVRTLTNGFSFNLVVGFPPTSFGAANSSDFPSEMQYNDFWGVKLGNRWYFNTQGKYGFGLMVNWLDFAMGVKSGTKDNILGQPEKWARTTVDATICGFGPIGTFEFNDDIAIDGYYNLRPTIISSGIGTNNSQGVYEDWSYGGIGLSNTLGTALRWRVINVGVEYVFGSINCKGTYTGPNGESDLGEKKQSINSVRLILGVKF